MIVIMVKCSIHANVKKINELLLGKGFQSPNGQCLSKLKHPYIGWLERMSHNTIESGHKGNIKNLFKVIYWSERSEILRFAEALAIKILNPSTVCPKVISFFH